MNTIISYNLAKLQSAKLQKTKIDNLNQLFSLFFLFFSLFSQVKDTTQVNKLDEVLVSAVRVLHKHLLVSAI
jgi:iron complex outermembrane receptor protein